MQRRDSEYTGGRGVVNWAVWALPLYANDPRPQAPFPRERWRHTSGPCWFQLTGREGERGREENKSHQPHLSVSHTTGYYYFFRGISLFPSSCHFFAPLFVLRSFLSWRLPTAATRLYSAVSTAFISALLILFIAPSGLTERSTDQLTDWQLLLEDELDSVNMVPFWI